jgi:cell division protein ZapA
MNELEEGTAQSACSVSVDIYDQTYHLRGPNPEYIQKLASMVDSKMRAVAAHGNTADSLRVAVLAAINVADELARLEESYRALSDHLNQTENLRTRANSLSGLLDSVLADNRRIG